MKESLQGGNVARPDSNDGRILQRVGAVDRSTTGRELLQSSDFAGPYGDPGRYLLIVSLVWGRDRRDHDDITGQAVDLSWFRETLSITSAPRQGGQDLFPTHAIKALGFCPFQPDVGVENAFKCVEVSVQPV